MAQNGFKQWLKMNETEHNNYLTGNCEGTYYGVGLWVKHYSGPTESVACIKL